LLIKQSSPVSGSDTEVASEEPREDFQKTGDEETNGDFYDVSLSRSRGASACWLIEQSVESPPVLAMDPSVDMLISDEEVRLHIRLDEDARDTEAMIEQWIEDGDIY